MKKRLLLLGIAVMVLAALFRFEFVAANSVDTVPGGTALELFTYVNRQLGTGMYVPDNDAERLEQVEKLERSLKAINLGLERVSADEMIEQPHMPWEPRKNLRTALLEKKNFVLWLLNSYAEGYTTVYLDFIAELEANPADREIAKRARGTYLNEIGTNLAHRKNVPITRETFAEYQQQVLKFLQDDGDNYIQSMALTLIAAAIRLADQEKDRSIATETAELCTALFENAQDEFNRSFAYRPMAILNKHYLAEDGLQIQGKLFNGELFDIAEYHGHPMLVVFWRSDPKAGEDIFSPAHASNLVFPKLKEIYEQYKDRGLEIIGICTDRSRQLAFHAPGELLAAIEELQAMQMHSHKTAESLPWKTNISEQLTIQAGLPSNEKRYDLWGEYIFFIAAEGRIRHQQPPNSADFDGMMSGPMKYLTEELEQKIKDYFTGIEVQFYVGKREIENGNEKIIPSVPIVSTLHRVEGDERFVAFQIANRSGRDMQNVELMIHAPTKQRQISDAVKTIIPESSGIEKIGDAYHLKVGTLSAEQNATMILEFEISTADRYLALVAEVLKDGERYGRYEMLLQVVQSKADR